MVWHIKKTSILGLDTVYYKGKNYWTSVYDDRLKYSSQAKAKAEQYIWEKKDWDVTAVNENKS